MIYIRRPPAPEFLKQKQGPWLLETLEAIKHYKAGNTQPFKFKTYNDTRLKEKLKEVFKKCAYCESSYGAVYDGDVEHFRPKGQVSEKMPKQPGYYWLANDWDNLFLSCQHCNQRRRHVLFNRNEMIKKGKLKSYGKLDQFPLDEGGIHATSRSKREFQREEKKRLLLNPCVDNPEKHFEYDIEHAVIIPLTKQGRKSVEVYVLQRHLLVQERKKHLILVLAQMKRVKRELERLNRENTQEQQQIFDDELAQLLEFTSEHAVYAGISRFVIGKFLKENGLA